MQALRDPIQYCATRVIFFFFFFLKFYVGNVTKETVHGQKKKKSARQGACLKHVFAFVIERSQLVLFRGNLVLSTELMT